MVWNFPRCKAFWQETLGSFQIEREVVIRDRRIGAVQTVMYVLLSIYIVGTLRTSYLYLEQMDPK